MKVYRWEDPDGLGPWKSRYMQRWLEDVYDMSCGDHDREGCDPIDLDMIVDGPSTMPTFERALACRNFKARCKGHRRYAFKSRADERRWIDKEWAEYFREAGLNLYQLTLREGGYIEDSCQVVYDEYAVIRRKLIRS